MMAEMIDGKPVDAGQSPALRIQASTELELLAAMEVPVGEDSRSIQLRLADRRRRSLTA